MNRLYYIIMLDPYRTVVVSLISSFVLLTGVFFYKIVFPKKRINLFLLLILILTLPTISIFRTGAYESGDFNIHVYRTIEFFRSLSEGNLMPSWAGNLNAAYGYPLFIFNYTLPYYFISLFHWAGFSFIGSLKIFLAINVILSGVFMFLFSAKLFKNNLAAFTASIFYVFAPYHLIDVHFKVVIGEILFFTILPLAFLFLFRLQIGRSLISILLFALSFAALIASHAALALFSGILILFYIFSHLSKNNYKNFPLYAIIAFAISSLISLYLWLGPLLLSKYSFVQNMTLKTMYFPTLQDLLYSPWRMGLLFQGPKGEISHLLGYSHLLTIILLLFYICRKSISKRIYSEVLFWIISFTVIIFLVLPYSKPLWEHFSTIKIIGSHRLLIFASFTSSILAGYLALIVKKQWAIYLLITLAVGSTMLNWGQRRVIPEINDNVLKANLWKSTSEGEAHFYANTKWVDIKNPWFSKLPNNYLEITNGKGRIKNIYRTSTLHKYTINADAPLKIRENTLYFPGWNAKLNGKILPMVPDDNGLISLNIPKGIHNLDIAYDDLAPYKITKSISLISSILVLICIIYFLFRKKPYAKK